MQAAAQFEPARIQPPAGRGGVARHAALAAQLGVFILGRLMSVVAQETGTVPPPPPSVGIDLRLNHQVPLDLKFRDETGQTVTLGSYFGSKPVILSLVYYGCAMMCTLEEHGLVNALRGIQFNLGDQYEVVTVSFDPSEGPGMARDQKAVYADLYGRPGSRQGWHFLVGDEPSIQALTQAVGWRYQYLRDIHQFDHPAGIVVLTPKGKVSRYFFGIQYPAKDVDRALVDASQGKIGNPAEMERLLHNGYSAGAQGRQ